MGGYGAVYGELRALETIGACRRGYFVEGLGGAQFALGGAVERLRELRPGRRRARPLVLAAADPAQPYGAALPWPKRAGARAARVAGAHVVLLGGVAALYVERGGRTLVPLREPDEEWLRPALAALVGRACASGTKRLAVERFDAEPVAETEAIRSSSRQGSSPVPAAPCFGLDSARGEGLDRGGRGAQIAPGPAGGSFREQGVTEQRSDETTSRRLVRGGRPCC